MFRLCITLTILGCAVAAPQYQIHQQQDEGIPPHLLRQYIGGQQQAQHAPRPAPQQPAVPQRLPYNVQEEQYQSKAQYQPQPQAQAQPQYRQQQQQQPEDFDSNPSYQFGFDVNDDLHTNYQNRKEQREGNVIKGSYSVVDSDGFIRTVTYTADPKEGFRAEVSRQPTDIVVKIPTPKPQTVQHQAPQQVHQQPQIQHQPQFAQQQRQQAPQQYYRYE